MLITVKMQKGFVEDFRQRIEAMIEKAIDDLHKESAQMKRKPKFTVKRGADGLWYYHLQAANGRIVMDGAEGYATKGNAERALVRTVALMREAVDEAEWTRAC